MTITKLIDLYDRHEFTPHHAAVEAALLVTPDNVEEIVALLPPLMRTALEEYVSTYQPGRMLSNYLDIPTPEQVELLRVRLARPSRAKAV